MTTAVEDGDAFLKRAQLMAPGRPTSCSLCEDVVNFFVQNGTQVQCLRCVQAYTTSEAFAASNTVSLETRTLAYIIARVADPSIPLFVGVNQHTTMLAAKEPEQEPASFYIIR